MTNPAYSIDTIVCVVNQHSIDSTCNRCVYNSACERMGGWAEKTEKAMWCYQALGNSPVSDKNRVKAMVSAGNKPTVSRSVAVRSRLSAVEVILEFCIVVFTNVAWVSSVSPAGCLPRVTAYNDNSRFGSKPSSVFYSSHIQLTMYANPLKY
jgi:hypothetical protein